MKKKKGIRVTKKKVENAFKIFGGVNEEIPIQQFGDLARYLGKNPSSRTVKRMIKPFKEKARLERSQGRKGVVKISVMEFKKLFDKIHDDITEKEMKIAFQIFSPEEARKEFLYHLSYSPEEFEEYIVSKFFPGCEFETDGARFSGMDMSEGKYM